MPNRIFTAPDGVVWQLWDVVPGEYYSDRARRHLPEEMADGWLCFESSVEKRRLKGIPQDWSTRPDAELWELCSAAEPVRRAARQSG